MEMGEDNTMMVGPSRMLWGTWEELILGGAVIRHGTRDWDVVASELRTRTVYPSCFTPEACKVKYEDLQRRYSGSTAWFEELRKRRVAELKQELERSEDSIGFLESKLESLKAEKGNCNQVDYDLSRTESPVHLPKAEGIETSGKETSKDELSAGSFTQDIGTNWLSKFQIPPLKIKSEVPKPCELEKTLGIEKLSETKNKQVGNFRKRRGKRKRKDSNWDAKEGSFIESDNLGSTNFARCNETSTSGCGQTVRSSSVDFQDGDSCRGGNGSDDLVGIFNSVTENKYAMVFRRRLDSQKRARYRKTVMQHMDLDMIRSRIATCSIKSAKELFRDLLLLANNAIVFYSKRTREYKSAFSLREIVTKKYREHFFNDSGNRDLSSILCFSSMICRPRSIRPRPGARAHGYLKVSNADSSTPLLHSWMTGNVSAWRSTEKLNRTDSCTLSVQSSTKAKKNDDVPKGHRKQWNGDPKFQTQSTVTAKRGIGRPRKVGGGRGNRQLKTPVVEERKKSQQK